MMNSKNIILGNKAGKYLVGQFKELGNLEKIEKIVSASPEMYENMREAVCGQLKNQNRNSRDFRCK